MTLQALSNCHVGSGKWLFGSLRRYLGSTSTYIGLPGSDVGFNRSGLGSFRSGKPSVKVHIGLRGSGKEFAKSRRLRSKAWTDLADPRSNLAETKRYDETYQRHFRRSRARHIMKRLNWQIWTGFILSLVAAFSYPFLFVRWPVTREFPWANLVLFAIALVFLFLGLRRAFKPDKGVVSRIFSSLAAAFGVFLLAALLFMFFVMGRWLPASTGAPQVGQRAPAFTLTDPNNKPMTLAQLLSEPLNNAPPKGVLLIFYRGYW